MYHYLFVTKGQGRFLIEEPSGRTLHRVLQLLERMKIVFPEVVFRPFKGLLTPQEYADLDLVFVVPDGAGPDLLGQIIEGFAHVLITHPEPDARVRIAGKPLKIDIGSRAKGERDDAQPDNPFAIGSKFLVALLRLDGFEPRWLPGTSSRRTAPKRRLAFFMDRAGEPLFEGKHGRATVRGLSSGE